MKLFFLSAQLQAFRLVDTFPWLFLISGKIKKKITKFDFFLILTYSFYFAYALFVATDLPSFLKVTSLLILISLATRINLKNYTKINSKNFYIVILIGLIIEDFLIGYNIISPFVRDPQGAFFFFREKSYFALIIFSLISFSNKLRISDLIFLFLIGIFVQSAVFWPIYIGLVIYLLFRKYSEHLINYFFIIGASISYTYIAILGSLENLGTIFKYFQYTDVLRILINLTSLQSDCIGTFYLQQCNEKSIVLDLKNNPVFSNWEIITAQAPFFLLYNFFGIPGIILSVFLLIIIFRKINNHRNRGFIFFNVLIQMFIQGFLLSPLFLWALSLESEKKFEK